MAPPTDTQPNPKTVAEWRNRVAEVFPNLQGGPHAVTLANLTMKHSASKMVEEDFLPLKIIWREKAADDFILLNYVNQPTKAKATQAMKDNSVGNFCKQMAGENIAGEKEKYPENSIFSLVQVYMDLINRIDAEASDASVSVIMSPQKRVLRSATAAAAASAQAAAAAMRARDAGSPTAGIGAAIDLQDIIAGIDNADLEEGEEGGAQDEEEGDADGTESSTTQSASSIGPDGGSPGNPKFIPPTNDEMTVNMAFVLLAAALMERKNEYARGLGYRWIADRDVYKIRKNTASLQSKKLLEARTDGGFRHLRLGMTASPLEVKPHVRLMHIATLQWQEGAQMAAHIQELMFKHDSRQIDARSRFGLLEDDPAHPGLKRRVHWGMNHGEIYINIFEYDDEYERYLRGPAAPPINLTASESSSRASATTTPLPPAASVLASGYYYTPGFMFVKSYGPWNVRSKNDITSICKIIFAVSYYLAMAKTR
ncbi:hypothetical protein B0H63DRAFT_559439 [Podospora didyma]|uniref:Uncharacterized protein n=1 Tax=Podospora didyma TaxID=330526 RepID=A0AAE0U2B8_9PEZI|nr:hypothetical protein B0H63DRAFT_559439 [Podospora didyma]